MNTIKLSYLKWRISQPNYYRDRAIQMGETYGAWTAEYSLWQEKERYLGQYYHQLSHADKMRDRYIIRMNWYAAHAALGYDESMDYQS